MIDLFPPIFEAPLAPLHCKAVQLDDLPRSRQATMKLNFANPATGQRQFDAPCSWKRVELTATSEKLIDIDDERKVRIFYDHRMSQEVAIDQLGDEWRGYVVKITGGNDKQGCVGAIFERLKGSE